MSDAPVQPTTAAAMAYANKMRDVTWVNPDNVITPSNRIRGKFALRACSKVSELARAPMLFQRHVLNAHMVVYAKADGAEGVFDFGVKFIRRASEEAIIRCGIGRAKIDILILALD